MKIDIAIIGKLIGKAAISPVAVAKEYNLGGVAKRAYFGIFISSGQSGIG
jgi:hypothetical protein